MATAKEQKSQLRTRVGDILATLSDAEVNKQSTLAQDVILSLPEYRAARRVGIYLCMPSAEAQTYALVRKALEANKTVFVPYLHDEKLLRPAKAGVADADADVKRKKKKAMSMLHLSSLLEYESLGSDSWGIPSLASGDIEQKENAMGGQGLLEVVDGEDGLDLIVMPGVAFDLKMNRIGHGAGFYDRFLARYSANQKRRKPFLGRSSRIDHSALPRLDRLTRVVGLCLSEQMMPSGEELVMQEWDWKVDAVAVGDGRLLRNAA